MEIETNTIKISGTTYLRIPPVMLKHLQIKEDETKMIVRDEESRHGKYFSAWPKGDEQ